MSNLGVNQMTGKLIEFKQAKADIDRAIDALGDSFPSWEGRELSAEAPADTCTAAQADRIIDLLTRIEARLRRTFP
jgi:hypothetical protein